ncbi:MAG: 3-phosphoshikimate 1-carboxyvinyltransferase [Colwellia sp.]|uniref:3-phosphoshikimate 1-carboxyvinyltransferase n=1 Tax=Colwellia sp. TaxID=56799 RepID=UPI001D49AEAB|nr:3-phosphoshikimate 1-carboxyvinyltransferase [Colwellia sp.]NQY50041.1 3-phosphoshikimate 1-carboxyvinyltransferase [Colwellia sp.]
MQLNTNDQKISEQPAIIKLLSRMPEEVADSFTDEQLTHLLTAVGSRGWGKHKVDFRGTFKLPFYQWRYYYVLLAGRNYRELSRQERRMSLTITAFISSLFIIFSATLGLLVLYLVKSALGIDIFPGFSLGIWDWFKETVL